MGGIEYAEDARVATLWTAAGRGALEDGQCVLAHQRRCSITFNLPQIWRTGSDGRSKLQRALSTPGLEQELSSALGRYPGGMDENVTDDEARARFAQRLLETKRPDFITVYLTGLDTEEHKSGPFSASSNDVLERLDAVRRNLKGGGRTHCAATGHGVRGYPTRLCRRRARCESLRRFSRSGLFTADDANKILSWKAMPCRRAAPPQFCWPIPAMLAVRAEVAALLDRLRP